MLLVFQEVESEAENTEAKSTESAETYSPLQHISDSLYSHVIQDDNTTTNYGKNANGNQSDHFTIVGLISTDQSTIDLTLLQL